MAASALDATPAIIELEATPVPPAIEVEATPALATIELDEVSAPTTTVGDETTTSGEEHVVPVQTPPLPQQRGANVQRAAQLQAIGLAAITILVLGTLAMALARHPLVANDDEHAAVTQPEPLERSVEVVAPRAEPVALAAETNWTSVTVAPRVESAAAKKAPKPEKVRATESRPVATIAAVPPVSDVASEKDTAARLATSAAIAAPTPAPAPTNAGGMMPVTITGCLEVSVDQDEFRLTDTEGLDAPKSRSWRTGFLTKRSAPVTLVEPPDRLSLQTHVGHRVAATGLLTSRDLKVNALRVVSPSCS